MTWSVAIVGATGRLGAVVRDVIAHLPDFSEGPMLSSGSRLEDMRGADLVVDVSLPTVSADVVSFALEAGQRVLVGTSGWSEDRLQSLRHQVTQHPGAAVLVVPNFSVGSVVASYLSQVAAAFFDSVEIVETHHQGKIDSPSGTAVRTAEEIARVRRTLGGVIAPHPNQSARGQQVSGIPVHSLRLSGAVAHQDVHFGGVAERVTISHDTYSSQAYRRGIELGLRRVTSLSGLEVGLGAALGLPVVSDHLS